MQVCKVEYNIAGDYVQVDSVRLGNNVVVVTGKHLKTARIIEEMHEDVENPEFVINGLKESDLDLDIFTFLERFPGSEPRYDYHTEWEAFTRMHITNFDHWWQNQTTKKGRNRLRKSEKAGVVVERVEYNDELLDGIVNIYNETPIRQGRYFWHYNKDIAIVKKDLSRDLARSDFFGAYHDGRLIGFMKLLYADRMAFPALCVSMIEHYDKCPNNALIAKAVEVCAERGIPYFYYGHWRRDRHAQFLEANGFGKVLLPRYYVGLTGKGKIALKLNLHRGPLGLIPDSIQEGLKVLRERVLSAKHGD
ncbi:MAG: GNAT family N-acetyltransferase [bacterium]|nr:MAG: GNAT family N-acetyltransferase [bacterium]